MQDTESLSPNSNTNNEMSPCLGVKYDTLIRSRTPSPTTMTNQSDSMKDTSATTTTITTVNYMSDDEISVGCPSPAIQSPNYSNKSPADNTTNSPTITNYQCRCNDLMTEPEDYFKPLKKLKMIETDRRNNLTSPTIEIDDDNNSHQHHQQQQQQQRIDGVKSFNIMDILNHKPSSKSSNQMINSNRIVRPWDIDPDNIESHQLQRLETFHRHLKVQQQLALLRPDFAAFNTSYTSETGSDRSSSVASDCCSPDIVPPSVQQRQRQQQGGKQQPGATPLDALFQMTSKTFDSSTGETSSDGQNHLNLFNNRQQPKKKRKSRTAFTNHQIFELEKRFLYQKYLSPADRDEIASSLGLTNAQVITWFQNRRAKLKRDMEELKKDVESAKLLTAHKSFLENVQDLGILKKKAIVTDDDCPKNLVINTSSAEK